MTQLFFILAVLAPGWANIFLCWPVCRTDEPAFFYFGRFDDRFGPNIFMSTHFDVGFTPHIFMSTYFDVDFSRHIFLSTQHDLKSAVIFFE